MLSGNSEYLGHFIDQYFEEQSCTRATKKQDQGMKEMQNFVCHYYGTMVPSNYGTYLDRPLPLFVHPGREDQCVEVKQRTNELHKSWMAHSLFCVRLTLPGSVV
jgi:hypothetical protein